MFGEQTEFERNCTRFSYLISKFELYKSRKLFGVNIKKLKVKLASTLNINVLN